MLCDQPCVTAAFINDLVMAYRSNGKGVIASEYGGTPLGYPGSILLLSQAFRPSKYSYA